MTSEEEWNIKGYAEAVKDLAEIIRDMDDDITILQASALEQAERKINLNLATMITELA